MGAAPSSPVTGDVAGQFRLTADQKTQHQVLSNIFQRLLRKNNLVDLAKTVSSEEQCKNLIVVLSSLLDKEFQTVRLPDYPNTSKLTTVSFTEAESYLALQNRKERLEICKNIAAFLVRFVVLVAALTASVNMPTGIPSPLKAIEQVPVPDVSPLPTVKSVNMNALNMLVDAGFAKKISEDTYKLGNRYFLNTRGFLYHEGDAEGKSALLGIGFVFGSVNGAASEPSASPYGEGTPARPTLTQGLPFSQAQLYKMSYERELEEKKRQLEGTFEQQLKAEQERKRQVNIELARKEAQLQALQRDQKREEAIELERMRAETQQKQLAAQPFSPEPPSRLLITNGRVSRRRRRVGGQYPMPQTFPAVPAYSGAPSSLQRNLTPAQIPKSNPALADYIIVQLYDALKCGSDGLAQCALGEFYMDNQGHTWSKSYAESAPLGALRVLESQPFVQRVESDGFRAVTSDPVSITLKRLTALEEGPKSTVEPNRKRAPFNVSLNTVQKLQAVGKELVGDDVKNFGPAVERAHLLAAPAPPKQSEKETAILTRFCKDPWVGSKVTNIPSFALLEALYADGEGVESQGSREKRDFIGKMEALDAWKRETQATNTLSLFSDYVVGTLPSSLGDFCSLGDEESQRIENEQQKAILVGAYREMNAKYNRHLQEVVRFLATLFVVDKDFWAALSAPVGIGPDPVFRLHPAFLTHPGGSLEKLKERCKAARDLLAAHYYDVEVLYRKAIQGFADIRMSKKVDTADVLRGSPSTTQAVGSRRATRRRLRRGVGTRKN